MKNTNPLQNNTPEIQRHTDETTSSWLVRRIIAGDRTAEAEAWVLYTNDLKKSAWRYANCRDDVDDRISITWEIALPKLRAGELINNDALRAFLCGIAKAVSYGELRKCPWLTISDNNEFIEQSLVDHRTPQDNIISEAAVAATIDMIDNLPVKRDREVLKQEYFIGVERDTMCKKYDVTSLQLSRWISRARKRLRDQVCNQDILGLLNGSV